MNEPLLELLPHLMMQSLMAIGGLAVVIPELFRVIVVEAGWLDAGEFTSLFALSQASPGPNMLFVSLIGWRMAGLPGALAATLAFLLPSMLLAGLSARLWDSWQTRGWFIALRRGLVPLTIGLMVASGWLLSTAAGGGDWRGYAVTTMAAALALHARIHPVLILAAAALVGLAGLV